LTKGKKRWYISTMSEMSKMLKAIVEKEGVTIRGLSRVVGIDHASLIRLLRESGNPESKTVEKILAYFGYEVKFIKRKGLKKGKSK
jgi:DNA-binding phage protein